MSDNISIKLENATISHPNNVVFNNINLEINKGEFIYIIGKTGSGKSSLLKSLYAEVPVTQGSVEVAGYKLESIKTRQIPYLRRRLGIIFQDFQLLTDRSVFDNLSFVLKATGWKKRNEIQVQIQKVLQMVELEYKEYKMPHELSGGEQQRVVIARALLNDPEIILADEPTGNLDPETSSGIMKILMNISQNNKTVLVATHDYPLLKQFPAKTIKCEKSNLSEVNMLQQDIIDFDKI
jgi:cell division transport system ATP-binding protein